MACLELGLRDDAGQRSMNLTAPRRCRIGVDAMGEQRMAVPNAAAVDHDDTMALGVVEQLCGAMDSATGRLSEDLDGRLGGTRSGQQHIHGLGVEVLDAHLHQIGQRGRQVDRTPGGQIADDARQLQRVERVSAANLRDAHHGRTWIAAAQPGGEQLVEPAEAQRRHVDPRDRVRCEVQPGQHAFPWPRTLGDEQSCRSSQASGDERDDRLAGRIEPLHIVDRDQDRCLSRVRLDNGQQAGREHPLVRRWPVGVVSQQNSVDGDALYLRKSSQNDCINACKQIGDRGVSQYRLGLPRAGRQHAESPLSSQLHGRQP
jgi:hypothetical protein